MNEIKRIYLAGKVTGKEYSRVAKEFHHAKQYLLSVGFNEVINPLEIIPKVTAWTESMLILLPHLAICNYIAILPGYESSNGTMTEYYFAKGMEAEGKLKAIIHLTHRPK